MLPEVIQLNFHAKIFKCTFPVKKLEISELEFPTKFIL